MKEISIMKLFEYSKRGYDVSLRFSDDKMFVEVRRKGVMSQHATTEEFLATHADLFTLYDVIDRLIKELEEYRDERNGI